VRLTDERFQAALGSGFQIVPGVYDATTGNITLSATHAHGMPSPPPAEPGLGPVGSGQGTGPAESESGTSPKKPPTSDKKDD